MNIFDPVRNAAEKIGLFFSRLFEKDVVVKITSLAAAVVIWFVISVSVYPEIDRVIYNVPVSIDLDGTYAEANGFQAMSCSAENVTVYLKGQRGDVGNLKTEDLVAVASAENVMYAMEYNLPINVECITGKSFTVTKVEPEIVSVNFDKVITKEVPVYPELSGITAGDGCVLGRTDEIVVVPNTVRITGPAETVENLTLATAIISEDTALTETTDFKTGTLKLYRGISILNDEDNRLSYDKSEFTVHVPVYAKKTVGLDVRITNAPSSFNTEKFKEQLEFSVDELEVAVPKESLRDNAELLDIGAIDMREVTIGKEFVFSAESFLPEGYQDWNGVGTITVKCPSEGLMERQIHIRSIQLVNAPGQYDFRIITSGVTPTIIGPAESMEQLTAIDVIAQIDLLNSFNADAEYQKFQKVPITFSIPAFSDVWCVGSDGALSPMATIQVTPKDGSGE